MLRSVTKQGSVTTGKTLTSSNLAHTLWGTVQKLEKGDVEVAVANSIAMQSREICRVAKLTLDAKRDGTNKSDFLL